MRTTLLLTAAALAAASSAAAQTTIGAPGGASVYPFGRPNTQTFGQTFTVPVNGDGRLDAFSFWMLRASDLQFRGYVFAWDEAARRATGPALFESAIMFPPSAGEGFQRVTLETGGVPLAGGGLYVAFLSSSGLPGTETTSWDFSLGDTYAGGEFVFMNNGDDTGAWTNAAWNTDHVGEDRDVRFEMQFGPSQVSAVPEPATVALSATGLAALAGFSALRRRGTAARG